MRDLQAQAPSEPTDPAKRAPYSPPRIEHLGSMSEFTATDPSSGGTDGVYGAGSGPS